jgi:drug/metabolite transporter (DMT)-like permease
VRTVDRRELGAVGALLLVTAAWGSTFFMIKDVITRLPIADLLAVRFSLAAVALYVFSIGRLRIDRRTLRRGALLGLFYGLAQILQTAGLAHTAASTSGFITGLYVVATPLLSALILRTRIPPTTWLAATLATIGLGVLSLHGFTVGYGELLTLASAVVYAAHIVGLGRLSDGTDARSLALIQMITIAVCCTVAALPGGITLPTSALDWMIVVYLAVVAGAFTMFAQTWAQARIDASRAAVIMAMEPVWAAVFAVTLGGESVTARMLVGGLAILSAIYLVELVPRRIRPRRAGAPRP